MPVTPMSMSETNTDPSASVRSMSSAEIFRPRAENCFVVFSASRYRFSTDEIFSSSAITHSSSAPGLPARLMSRRHVAMRPLAPKSTKVSTISR